MPAILDQAIVQQRADRLRHVGRECLPIRFEADHRAEHLGHVRAVECARSRQHLVQDAAERPDVAALVRLAALRLFGRHVGGRTQDHADAGQHRGRRNRGRRRDVCVAGRGFWVRKLGEAEVQDLHRPVRPNLDVGRFQVAVNDPLLVRCLERLGDLRRDGQCVLERDRAAPQSLRQILAFDQLHDEGVHITGFFKAVDVSDVRMVQRREGLGFARETCEPFGVVREAIRQNLDRHVAIEVGVPRAIDLAHAAGADQRDDFIRAEASSGRQRHDVPGYCRSANAMYPRGVSADTLVVSPLGPPPGDEITTYCRPFAS